MVSRMQGDVSVKSSLLYLSSLALAAALATGCASQAEESDGNDDDDTAESENAFTESNSDEGVLYFHGMSRLGFQRDPLRSKVGQGKDLYAPSLTDGQIQGPPSQNVLSFLENHPKSAVVSGYSLGRIPVFRLMKSQAKNMTRVVMIDPTYDSAFDLGKSIGGGITKRWLEGDDSRTFLFVYGDATKALGGERSYLNELKDHPRAELCYIPGDHERFRRNDMTYAVNAESCEDLKEHLRQ
jgi:hypothetical protein